MAIGSNQREFHLEVRRPQSEGGEMLRAAFRQRNRSVAVPQWAKGTAPQRTCFD
jgi:hypothetical protein